MARKRYRLVPREGIEAFEIRQVLFLDAEGRPVIDFDIDKPDHSGADDVAVHEVLGVMLYSALMLVLEHVGFELYEPEDAEGSEDPTPPENGSPEAP